MQANTLLPMFQLAWKDWNEDRASRLAAALAYYTALSLAPLMVLGVLLLKFLELDEQHIIENQMAMLMGAAGREIAEELIVDAELADGWMAGGVSTSRWDRRRPPTELPGRSPRC